VGQDAQTDFAVLAVIGSCSQGRTEVSLEHAEDGFDLPSLAIDFLGEALLHQLAISAPHGARFSIASWVAVIPGWDNAANPQGVATKTMEGFRFIAGIAQQRGEALVLQGIV
jgi:hypothetical protein